MGFSKIYHKRPKILALWPFQGCKAKKEKDFKNQVWLKMLRIVKISENAKIAKQIQKASIWPIKASKLNFHARFYLTKLVSKYIHNRIFPSEK